MPSDTYQSHFRNKRQNFNFLDPTNLSLIEYEYMKHIYFELRTKDQIEEISSQLVRNLKDPSQPPPFSMPSKLLILHGEAKSYCFTVSCVPESIFHYL